MARIALLICAALLVALPAAAPAATVKAPKSGTYEGPPPVDAVLQVAGKSIQIAAFSFECKKSSMFGRTSINDFPLKRTSRGYRFDAKAKSIASYTDETDENVSVHATGRFAKDGKSVRGHVRVKSKRCGDTGVVKWRASR
jgi:hypothetical protein